MERTYPYKAWTLQPSFKPVEVELVEKYKTWGEDYGDVNAAGKLHQLPNLFPSKEAAIAEGWARVEKQAADLDKRLLALEKKRIALRKAA